MKANAPNQTRSGHEPLVNQAKTSGASTFVDTRPHAIAQRKYIDMAHDSVRLREQKARIDGIRQYQGMPVQCEGSERESSAATNHNGLPNQLKAGIESLSGMAMDHVKVHYNSSQPAQLNALAYAQGSDIHIGPGQEKHLPHEAWHVVQQAQGRVRPTKQMKAGVAVNDDKNLEHEADVMGGRAMLVQAKMGSVTTVAAHSVGGVAQLATLYKKRVFGLPHWEVTAREAPDPESRTPPKLWQVGFSNPTAIAAMSGSVSTKSGSSPLGFGGQGEVKWSDRSRTGTVKGGYQEIVNSTDDKKDPELLAALPKNGARRNYRLTSHNCQHFIVDAWSTAGLAPPIDQYLTLSARKGHDINSGLLGGAVGAAGAVAVGGAALASLPVVAAATLGMGVGVGVGRKVSAQTGHGLLGGAIGAMGAVALGGAALMSLPVLGAAALGAGVGLGLGHYFGSKDDKHIR